MRCVGLFVFFAAASFLTGCATTDLKVPPVDQIALEAAKQEIHSAPTLDNTYIPEAEADKALAIIFDNLQLAAQQVCRDVGEDECRWDLELSDSSDFNAYATGEAKVVIHHGIFNYAKGDEEVAFVLAHELGHHIADHIHESQVNATTGALVGGLLMGALGAAAASPYDPYAQQRVNDMTRAGMNAGAAVGSLTFSVAQEKEADFLGTQILRGAGYDPRKARPLLITMAKLSGVDETGFLATHPAGPERLASFDKMQYSGLGKDAEGKLALVPIQDALPATNQPVQQVAVRGTGLYEGSSGTQEPRPSSMPAFTQQPQTAMALVSAGSSAAPKEQLKHEFSAQKVSKSIGCERDVSFVRKQSPAEFYQARCSGEQFVIIRCEFSSCEVVK